MTSISRRTFLGLPVAAALASCDRRRPYAAADFVVPPRTAVAVLPAPDYRVDFADLIFRGLEELRLDVRGRTVLLKPNVVEYEAGTAINTHPLVVAGAAEALRRAGVRTIVVGEGPGHRRDIEYLLTGTGLWDVLRDIKAPFVDLNHDDVVDVPLRSRFTGLTSISLPVSLRQADLVVSLPKLKTHHWVGMTCGMKNLFGVVPGAVYGWPKNLLHVRGIQESILDLVATIRPGLTIVDGVVGMEGDGPIMGTSRPVGCIVMGADVVAVDATCARVMRLEPSRIQYLKEASRFLGHIDDAKIDQRGERPARFQSDFKLIDLHKGLRTRS